MVAAQNYAPGGIRLFDAQTLEALADVPAIGGDGRRSKVVGLADLPGRRFAASLFESGEIWIIDAAEPRHPQVTRLPAGREPYDALVTPDGRWYLAGLFGEDGLTLVDLWQTPPQARRILSGLAGGISRCRSTSAAPAWLGDGPGPGHGCRPLVATKFWWRTRRATGRRLRAWRWPGSRSSRWPARTRRQVWVNFAFPHNDVVQVIDTASRDVVRTLRPCRGVLHMEFTPKGEGAMAVLPGRQPCGGLTTPPR